MNVIIRITGDVEIDDECDFRDIQTTGSDIGSDEDTRSLSAEAR
jgi:hypothetical protein